MLTKEQIRDRLRIRQVTLNDTSSLLTEDAAADQKDCEVSEPEIFSAGMAVLIKDNNHSEYNEVASVSGDTVTLQNTLVYTYETGEDGTVIVIDLFSTKVAERKMRYIIGIWINGDGTSRTVEIGKQEEDHVNTMLFDNIPIPPADQCPVPEFWHFDIENPCIVLEGGTNLTGIASAGNPELTVIYWDTPEI